LLSQEKPSGETALSYVEYLASDALKGRDTGTPGYEKAVRYVAEHYEKWGLEPAGDNGTYVQEFPFAYHQYQFEIPQLVIEKRAFYAQDRDFSVPRYTGGGKVEAEVVFVGYGISDPDRGLDEYAGLNVRNKIVLAMRGAPSDDVERWKGVDTDSAKTAVAQMNGAAGIMLCADFQEENRSVSWWRLRPGNYKQGFIAYGVDERVVRFLLKKDELEPDRMFLSRMREQQKKLDIELVPMSFNTGKKARMEVEVEYDAECIGKNVLGMIRGTDPDVGDEVIVLGAHLDHLGVRFGQVYPGADDNASGSAVVMEAARVMMANQVKPRRTIVFACWGGEERGLLGSRHYAKHPTLPIEKTVLNFNLDMVGLGDKSAFGGVYYGPKIWKIIKGNATEETLDFLQPDRGGPGGSDHTPFIVRGIPAFFLITRPWDAHPDYHQPGDVTEKISAELMGKVAEFLYYNTLLIANYDENLMVENRHALYIHKSAVVANLHPVPYEAGMAVLDSLENEWIDIQLVTVPPDSLENPSERLTALLSSLDEAMEAKTDLSKPNNAGMAFSSRRDGIISVTGLEGVESVSGDVTHLRMAAKLGAKYFILNGADGKWICPEKCLTDEGKKAIKVMNKQKIIIILRNQPEQVVSDILETSRHPVIIAGVKNAESMNADLLKKIGEKGGLLALAYNPSTDADDFLHRAEAFKESIGWKHLVLYPCFGGDLHVDRLDEMLNITIALKDKGMDEQEIGDLLGGNLESIFRKVLGIRPQRRHF
jgi:microsomal dipeptidase-like Zn-dependent dipeptidase